MSTSDSEGAPKPDAVRLEPAEYTPETDWIEIGNEFASVLVRRVQTRNGVRLQVRSAKLDADVFLDAVVLESLTWQTADSLSLLLETPLEPLKPRETS